MKKFIYSSIALLFICTIGFGQSLDDVVRISQNIQTGTSRFNAMGGAFTALGGDISSAAQNPAGIAFFRSSEITFTPIISTSRSTSSFATNSIVEQSSKVSIPQFGIIISGIKTNKSNGLLGVNFAYTYNRTNNYRRDINVKGVSNYSSRVDSWQENSEGILPQSLDGDRLLAFNTFLIDTISTGNPHYVTVFDNYGTSLPTYGQTLRYVSARSGSAEDHSIAVSGNISDKFYIGMAVGVTNFFYKERIYYAEYGTESHTLDNFGYNYLFNSNGHSVNFKIGAIYRPIESLRIGFAYHTPTYYVVKDKIGDELSAYYTNKISGETFDYSAQNRDSYYDFRLRTPSRLMVGLAYQIAKIATLSVDYEYINFSKAQLSDNGDMYDYSFKNHDIKYNLRSTHNVRVGGEVRLSPFYVRGGYAFYGSPWVDGDYNSKNNFHIASAGFGYRKNIFSIDLAYSLLLYKQTEALYFTSFDSPTFKSNNSLQNISLTLGFRF